MKTGSIWTSLARLGASGSVPGFGRRASLLAALFLGAALGLPAAAVPAPADPTNCIASAQNRSAPMTRSGDFVVSNLPGSGFVPFATTDAQPFRIRVTCNDGTVGETALTFPLFEQSLVETGAIIWGQRTPVPTQLRLDLPSYAISPGSPSVAGQVTARYADGTEKVVTARTAGTGYRSSSAGFVAVSNDGRVYLQSAGTLSTLAGSLPVPSIITITAENDGVVSSRLVQLVSTSTLSGKVTQADGRDVRGLEVRLSIAGYDDLLATTDAAGDYRFSSLPFAVSRYADLLVLDRANRRAGSAKVLLDADGNGVPPQIVLQGAGMVRINVVDAAGAPQAGVSVGVSDAYSRALGLAPSILTADASGQAAFLDVPSGTVVAVSSAAGYSAAPGHVLLAPGAVAAVTLRATGATPTSQAGIVGHVLQQPSLTAAVGAAIELLENKLGAAPMRQVVDGSGRFSFAGLPVNTLFNYQVKMGAEVLANGGVYTGLAGSQQPLNVELPAQRGLNGIVLGTDGLTPAPGVAVQLSYFDSRFLTWTAAGAMSSRADGSFIWRYLEPRRHRLQALAADGSSATIEVDLSTAPPNSMQNNLRLQLASRPAQVKLGLRATVLGAADFGPLGADLFVRNSSCTSWCALGQVPTTTDTLTTDFLGQGRNDFELRWRGRVQAFAIDVGPANDGQTVSRVIDFGPDASGVNRIPAQRSLYSFDVAQGARIYAAVLGRAQDGLAAAAAVKYELYDPSGQLLAAGKGFDPARTPNAAAQAVNHAAAPAAGRYTLVVGPLNADAGNLGGYGLLINVADLVAVQQPWAAAGPARFGGQAAGRVFQFSGAPAPGNPVVVSAGPAGKLQLVEQVIAAADGSYAHLNLPLGPVVLEATDADGAVFARVQAGLAADGERVAKDLHMAARTRVGLNLHLSPGSVAASGGTAKVDVVDAFNNRTVLLQVPAGALDGIVEFAVAGDQGTLKIGHPSNALLIAERTVAGSDGDRVVIDVAMPTGRVVGQVLSGTSEAVDQAQVSALNGSGVVVGQLGSAQNGTFVFPALPPNTNLQVQARDVALDVSATVGVTPLEGVDVVSSDLVLPTASVSGSVKKTDGSLLAGVPVEASFAGATLSTVSDASGRYAFVRIPAERIVALIASDVIRGKSQPVNVQGDIGERIEADIVFRGGVTLKGRLLTASGLPLGNLPVYLADTQISGTGFACQFPISPYDTLDTVQTDAAGNYTFANVPAMSAKVFAKIDYRLGCDGRWSGINISATTGTQVVPDFVFDDTAGFKLRVVDPAGNAVPAMPTWAPSLRLQGPFPGELTVPLPGAAGDDYQPMRTGAYTAIWNTNREAAGYAPVISASVTLPVGSSRNLDVVVPMLRGRVVYSDGSPVNSAAVWMLQSDGWKTPQTIMATMGGPEVTGGAVVPNSYLIAPFRLGDYVVVAQDNATGMERRWTGNFSSLPTQPLTLVMPGTAKVEGCVTLPDGSPVRPDEVRLISPAIGVQASSVSQLSSTPSAAGCFQFPRVPTGDAVLHAFERSQLKAVLPLTIPPSAHNGTVQANVQYPTQGEVKCLTPADESLGAAERANNVLVPHRIEQTLNLGYAHFPRLNTVAGPCLQQYVLPGRYRAEQSVVDGNAAYGMRRGHVLDVQVSPGQEVTGQMPAATMQPIPAIFGSSTYLDVPVGATTFMFDDGFSGGNGQLYSKEVKASGGEYYFFNDWTAPGLLLNGFPLPPRSLLLTNLVPGARELFVGPYEQGNQIKLIRRLYVPDTGGYARLLETVTNDSGQTQVVKLAWLSPVFSGCNSNLTLITGLSNNLSAGYAGFQDCQGAMLHVFAGAGSAANQGAANEVELAKGSGLKTQWSMTLAPGQSASIMHFVVAAPSTAKKLNAITTGADALARLGDAKMLQGLTATDRSIIRNFTVGQ